MRNRYITAGVWLAGVSGISMALCSPALAQTQPAEVGAQGTAQEGSAQNETAQQDTNEDGTIVVTATRRSESILDVPISIVAYSQESLDKKGIRNLEDLVRMTPGVTLTQGFSNIKYIAIRGLNSSAGATMTGIYIDDTPIHIRNLVLMTFTYPALYDLERVEVLRGPQGTLFGSSAMGGAVRFITAKPTLTEFTGNVRSELAFTEGGDPTYELGAAIGGPIIKDKLGFRVSGYYRRDGGYIDRVPLYPTRAADPAEENANSARTLVANASLLFRPIESLSITPSVFYQKANRDDTSTYLTFGNGSTRPQPPIFQSANGFASVHEDETILFQNKIEWDVGPVSLISNTAYIDRKINSRDDGTGLLLDVFQGPLGGLFNIFIQTPAPFGPGGSGPFNYFLRLPGTGPGGGCGECYVIELDDSQKGFTQEFRVQSNDPNARLRYVLGAFYQKTKQRSHDIESFPFAPGAGAYGTDSPFAQLLFGGILFPIGPTGAFANVSTRNVDEQYAVFGQVDFELFDRLTLTAGLRYSVLKFESQQLDVDVVTGADIISPIRRSEDKPLTPKFGIEYEIDNDMMVYAIAAKGFRAGGFNVASEQDPSTYTPQCLAGLAQFGLTEIPASYTPDSVWSYEVGAKGRVGTVLTFAADVFYTEWNDVQRLRNVPGCGVYTDNFGKARTQGIEANITLTPVKGLTLDANLAYIDATQRETINVPGSTTNPPATNVRKGDRFATPWTINLSADYQTPIGWDDARAYATVQYTYRSEWNAKPGNAGFNPITANTDSQNKVDARIGIRRNGFDISAFVNNLTNSRDTIGRLNFQPSERIEIQTWRPRTFGITGRYNF